MTITLPEALVPVDTPQLSSGWEWTELGNILIDIQAGKSCKCVVGSGRRSSSAGRTGLVPANADPPQPTDAPKRRGRPRKAAAQPTGRALLCSCSPPAAAARCEPSVRRRKTWFGRADRRFTVWLLEGSREL